MKTRQLIQFWEQKKQENVPKDWEVDKAPSNQGQVEDNLQDIGPEDLEAGRLKLVLGPIRSCFPCLSLFGRAGTCSA